MYKFNYHFQETPTYSFGYDVSDTQTGDVKTLWETKEGDTVKGWYFINNNFGTSLAKNFFIIFSFIIGHYSVLEPDGSVRTVEYSASPGKGFTAAVNNEGVKRQTHVTDQPKIEDRSYRDYKKPYDYSEDSTLEFYSSHEMRNKKRPYDAFYNDYSMFKRPSGPDSEVSHSNFPHNLPSKHFYDEIGFDSQRYGHIGHTHDSNCKTKHTKENTHLYKNLEDFDFRKHKKPSFYPEVSNDDKYLTESDTDKYLQRHRLKGHHKSPRPYEYGLPTSIKYSYPILPDMPQPESFYHDEVIQRPKKKHRLHKNTEGYTGDDLSDYVLVPKKKLKKPPRELDIDYASDFEEDYDHFDNDDDRNHKPHRGSGHKEVIRKIVKKKKPSIVNFLDILDI